MGKTLTDAEEKRLLDAAKRAHDLISDGQTPDDAVEKIARELKCGSGEIGALCHAINTGRQLRQWEKGASVLERMAPFALASPEEVTKRIYAAEKQAAAIDEDYSRPPTWLPQEEKLEKQAYALPAGLGLGKAAAVQEEPVKALWRAQGEAATIKRAVDMLAQEHCAAEAKAVAVVGNLVAYFQKSAADRLPFAQVETAVIGRHGESGRALMDHVYSAAKLAGFKEKRADAKTILRRPYSESAAPFTLIKSCFDAANMANEASSRLKNARDYAAELKEASLRPFAAKQASIFGTPAMGAGIATMLGNSVKSGPELVDGAVNELDDPAHLNEMRRIRATAMLNGMMTDPDNPISTFEPHEVMNAYNEISQAVPRASETAAVLAPLLRRKLEGRHEPFEAKEMIDTEKSLSDVRAGSRGSLLGGAQNILR